MTSPPAGGADEKVYRCRWRYTPPPQQQKDWEGEVTVTAKNLQQACERARNKAVQVGMYEGGIEILSAEIRRGK